MISDKHIRLYQSIQEAEQPRVMRFWHASSLAECPRSQYFQRLGIAPLAKPSAAKILRWRAGHLMEEAIRQHVASEYAITSSNSRITAKDLDLTGEYDNLSEPNKQIVEIKSVHDYAFIERNGVVSLKEQVGTKGYRRLYEPKTEPYLHHQIQNHAYALLLESVGKPVETIAYVYISLSGRLVTYETPIDPKITERVLKRLKTLQEAWESKTPPDCICSDTEHDLYGPVMQYCPYSTDMDCCALELIKDKETTNVN